MRFVAPLLLCLAAASLSAQGYLKVPADLPAGVQALSVGHVFETAEQVGQPPASWPASAWTALDTPEGRRVATTLALAFPLPDRLTAGQALWFFTTAPVERLWVGSQELDPQTALQPLSMGWYLPLSPEWSGKTVFAEQVNWGTLRTRGWVGPETGVATQAKNWIALLQRYPFVVPMQVKEGRRDAPGPWRWPRELFDYAHDRGRSVTFRLVLPAFQVEAPTLPWDTDGVKGFTLYLDGKKIADRSSGLVVENTHFVNFPVDWQDKVLEVEVDFSGVESIPLLGLFDGHQYLGTWVDGLHPSFTEMLYGWGGLAAGVLLLLMAPFRRKDRVLLPMGIALLLLALLEGPASHRSALYSLSSELSDFVTQMLVAFSTVMLFGMYRSLIPDPRVRWMRLTWIVLAASVVAFAIPTAIGIASPDWWPKNLPVNGLELGFAVIVLGWIGVLILTNPTRSPEALFFAAIGAFGLSSAVLPLVDGRVFRPGIGLPHWFTETWNEVNLLSLFAVLVAMPVYQFFRNESLLHSQNRLLLDTNRVFKRFVPQEFLDVLGISKVHEIQLGRQKQQNLSILFSDIRGFSGLAKKLEPAETFAFINEFLEITAPVIRDHGGYIDKYLGDGIMAVFPGQVSGAFRAVNGLCRAVEELNQRRLARGEEPVGVGIGAQYGHAMLGTIGHADRMDSTVISDTVNTASRLESLTKYYGVPAILGGAFVAELSESEKASLIFLDRVNVYGRDEPLTLWESLEAYPAAQREARKALAPGYQKAWDCLQQGDLAGTQSRLEALLATHGPQTSILRLQERLRSRRAGLSKTDGEGIEILDFK